MASSMQQIHGGEDCAGVLRFRAVEFVGPHALMQNKLTLIEGSFTRQLIDSFILVNCCSECRIFVFVVDCSDSESMIHNTACVQGQAGLAGARSTVCEPDGDYVACFAHATHSGFEDDVFRPRQHLHCSAKRMFTVLRELTEEFRFVSACAAPCKGLSPKRRGFD